MKKTTLCVPDLPGHRMPPTFTIKSLKIESPLNQLKQTQCTVLLNVCAHSSVLCLPSAGLILSETSTASVQFVLGNGGVRGVM